MQMTFEDAVVHIRKKPSHCVPDGYSMISITNAHHTILTLLQIALIPSCLLQRTLVYCDRSVLHNVSFSKNCYWSTATFRPSDFPSNDYQEITWLKWDLLVQATRSGPTLFVDADVLILRNPFDALPRSGRDMYYQRELYDSDRMNNGVLWVRNNSVAKRILDAKPQDLTHAPLEQDIVYKVTTMEERKPLPHDFVGHCWAKDKRDIMRIIVTYHAHCARTFPKKLDIMTRILKEFFACNTVEMLNCSKV